MRQYWPWAITSCVALFALCQSLNHRLHNEVLVWEYGAKFRALEQKAQALQRQLELTIPRRKRGWIKVRTRKAPTPESLEELKAELTRRPPGVDLQVEPGREWVLNAGLASEKRIHAWFNGFLNTGWALGGIPVERVGDAEAVFVSFFDPAVKVVLQDRTGREYCVPVVSLSPGDREYLKQFAPVPQR